MFHYDAMGNPIVKIVINKIPSQTPGEFEPQSQDEWDYTFYTRDASGNVMAVYSKSFSSSTNEDFSFVESLDLTELHIYGSSRLGMRDGKGNTISNCLNSSGDPAGIQVAGVTYEVMTGMTYSSIDEDITSELNQDSNEPCATYFTLIEYKTFELSDHLGNVSATISDRKISVWNTNQDAVVSYNPDVLSQQDYYPFGMGMPERIFELGNDYRYGFNGVEDNSEISNTLEYGLRIFDPRITRWFSIDPKVIRYPSHSSYSFCFLSPLRYMDIRGGDPGDPVCSGSCSSFGVTLRTIAFGFYHPLTAYDIGDVTPGSTNMSTRAVRLTLNTGTALWEHKAAVQNDNIDNLGSGINAMRHVLWQASIRVRYGDKIAKEVGFAHEENPNAIVNGATYVFSGEDALLKADETIDLLNNEIGRAIGEANPGLTMKALALKTLEHFHNEGFYVASYSTEKSQDGTEKVLSAVVYRYKLTDEQYANALKQLETTNNNGYTPEQQKELDEKNKQNTEDAQRILESAGGIPKL